MAPGRGARGVCVAVNVRVPRCFGNPQPNCNPVAVSHARRNPDTVPITDTDTDGIRRRHRVAYGLRDTDTDTDVHAHAHADCHSHIYGDRHTDTYSDADCDSNSLRIGRGAVISGA